MAAVALLAAAGPAVACSLCPALGNRSPSFRQEAAADSARLILFGTLANARVNAAGNGTTDFHVKAVLRADPILAGRKVLELPRYVPVADEKDPPRFLIFCDVFKGKLDPYRGVPVKDDSAVDYLRKALALDPQDRTAALAFFFNYLDHPDPEVARDAYVEFASASDGEVAKAAPRLSADKLRTWLADPKTPAERIGLYAFLLGACGTAGDADFLRKLLDDPGERTTNAYDGLLSGYILRRPKEGWELTVATLGDGQKPLPVRLAAVRALRFYMGAHPAESRPHVLRALSAMLAQGELADIAVEDLRRFKAWDLTRQVLALYGRKGTDAPIVQRAIVRYALMCADADCRRFLADLRQREPDLVKEVEESLQFER